jgi:hypothetical protein
MSKTQKRASSIESREVLQERCMGLFDLDFNAVYKQACETATCEDDHVVSLKNFENLAAVALLLIREYHPDFAHFHQREWEIEDRQQLVRAVLLLESIGIGRREACRRLCDYRPYKIRGCKPPSLYRMLLRFMKEDPSLREEAEQIIASTRKDTIPNGFPWLSDAKQLRVWITPSGG